MKINKLIIFLILLIPILFSGCVNPTDPEWDYTDSGDINLNGIAYEIADAVVFSNYFLYGTDAFTINPDSQRIATEIDHNGVPLEVSDFQRLIRIIVGDALPLPKNPPIINANVAGGDYVSINAECGAAAMVFKGDADIQLAEGAAGMEFKSYYNGKNTKVLIYSVNAGETCSGDLVRTDAKLLSIEAVDYNGYKIKAKILPTDFVLNQNYPNPFSERTTISMSLPIATDWKIEIFNANGSKVKEFSGTTPAGVVSVVWDATGMSSGYYAYRATAGEFSDIKQMLLTH